MVNKLLNNEDRFPYTFYILDQELVVSLNLYCRKTKKVLSVVCQPQAIFRIRPVNRCSATIAGHSEAVLSVAFRPDGKQLASGSGDISPIHLVSGSKAGELQCWDPLTAQPSGNPLVGHKKWITGLSWEPVHLSSPCRRFVSSREDGDACIRDVTLRRCVICLSSHTLAITCINWGGDVVTYTGNSQGKLIRELNYVLRTVAFDHTGKQYSSSEEMKQVALESYKKMKGNAPEKLVSGSDDFTMFLWETSVSKHPNTRMTDHQQLGDRVYFSPDGQWVASASFDRSVKVWSADSRLLLSGSKDYPEGQLHKAYSIWDIRTKKLKQDLPGHADENVFAVDWNPDGENVASGGKDKVLKLWMG
ncbi:hypothetical protein ACJRO7_029342 [Eucalyptus globulus]|uniref:Uncharacterized protein n=1 Tax=Eucalyptus globulus TaxID=34317 RepID=A0ABD3KAK6_EUCGL